MLVPSSSNANRHARVLRTIKPPWCAWPACIHNVHDYLSQKNSFKYNNQLFCFEVQPTVMTQSTGRLSRIKWNILSSTPHPPSLPWNPSYMTTFFAFLLVYDNSALLLYFLIFTNSTASRSGLM
jgi:hypothetical protein